MEYINFLGPEYQLNKKEKTGFPDSAIAKDKADWPTME
jgi:hypothetical protein